MQPIGRIRADTFAVIVVASAVGIVAALFATGFSVGSAVDAAVHPAAMAVLLGTIGIPLIRWAVDGDQALFRLVVGGLFAKCVGTYLRFTLTGDGDNRAYHAAGSRIAGWLSEAIVGPDGLPQNFGQSGTHNLSYAVGWLYYFTGPNRITAFVVFTFISFVGMLFFYRAAVSAVPELDRRRYALLLFYMPSMLFWPSTIGKEAWMIGFVGVAAMGASGMVRHRFAPGYLVALIAGLSLAAQVRPHIPALVVAALVAAMVWPTGVGRSRGRQLVGVAVAFVFLVIALGQVADYFGADSLELSPILDFAQGRTSGGGSEFSPTRISGPLTLIPGAVGVLFRPFLFEASSTFQLLGALEGGAVVVLAVASHRRIRRVPRLFLENGYIRFAVIYILGFVIAFSVISNFGILTRQRSQLWPLFMILLALRPTRDSAPAGTFADDDGSIVSADSSP